MKLKKTVKKNVNVYKNVAKIKLFNEINDNLIEYYNKLCQLEEDLFYIEVTDPVRLHGYEYENKQEDIYNHMRFCKEETGYSWEEFKEMIPYIAFYFQKNI